MRRLTAAAILSATVLCTACVPPVQNAYRMGEQNFKVQNYHTAFQNLLLAAKGGIANAQYAVGYMYFYGLGVAKSEPLAIFWLQKAAQSGQPQAMAVMQTIIHMEENPVLQNGKKSAAQHTLKSLSKPMKKKAAKKTAAKKPAQ